MSARPGRFVVGIDGGGTRTRAVILNPEGVELGRAEGGPTLVRPGTPGGEVLQVLKEVTLGAVDDAGVELPAAALHAGLAGVGREWVRQGVEAAVEKALGGGADPSERLVSTVRIGTDSDAAFHAAFGDGPGLLVISGTGSIGWGRGESGKWARVGGWGSLLGDEGSGYRIGLDALRAAVRSEDGRGERSELAPMILDMLEMDDVEELVDWSATAAKGQIAILAPLVRATARAGDEVARRIIAQGAVDMVRHVTVLLERLGPWSGPPGLALCGGLLSPTGLLRESFLEAVAELPCRPVQSPIDAARGAALLALSALQDGETTAGPTPAP